MPYFDYACVISVLCVCLFMFSFFALCLSFLGSTMLYVSYIDDRIMKRYADKGTLTDGEVVATELVRGCNTGCNAGCNADTRNYSGQRDYLVSVHYTCVLSENNRTLIRKKIRALECDFCPPDQTSQCSDSKSNPLIEILCMQDDFFQNCEYDHQGKKVQLLVLPDQHLSALPASQIKRRLSTKSRISSLAFALVSILIAVLCLNLAMPPLWQRIYGEREAETRGLLRLLAFNLSFVMIALFPVTCIHFLLRDMVQSSLENEYFKAGAKILKGGGYDDSSLSSKSEYTNNYFESSIRSITGLTQSTSG